MSDLCKDWAEVCLADIAEVRLGRQRSPKNHSGAHMRPYLRAANVDWNGLKLNDVKTMNFTDEEAEIYRLQAGDIVLGEASGSASEVGKPALWNAEIDDCCFQNTLLRVRSYGADRRFLVHYLRYEAIRGAFAERSRGVGIHHLGAERLANWPIHLPPLGEQGRIVAALEDHLSRLSAAQRYIDRASNATVTVRTSLRAREIVGHREGVVLGGPLNPGWTWGRLGDLLTGIEAGRSFTCEPRRAEYDEWGVIKVSAMTWGEFREEENKAVPGGRKIDPRHEIHPGDVLVSRANTEEYVGAPVLVRSCRRGLLLSDKSLRLVPKSWVDKEWLVQLLASPLVRRQISMTATGNQDSMRNISQRDLRMIRVPIAPEEDQASIADSLGCVF